jgi:hypothetical protein
MNIVLCFCWPSDEEIQSSAGRAGPTPTLPFQLLSLYRNITDFYINFACQNLAKYSSSSTLFLDPLLAFLYYMIMSLIALTRIWSIILDTSGKNRPYLVLNLSGRHSKSFIFVIVSFRFYVDRYSDLISLFVRALLMSFKGCFRSSEYAMITHW